MTKPDRTSFKQLITYIDNTNVLAFSWSSSYATDAEIIFFPVRVFRYTFQWTAVTFSNTLQQLLVIEPRSAVWAFIRVHDNSHCDNRAPSYCVFRVYRGLFVAITDEIRRLQLYMGAGKCYSCAGKWLLVLIPLTRSLKEDEGTNGNKYTIITAQF